MPTVRVVVESPLPPDRILQAAHDFSARRQDVFPAVSLKHMELHDLGESTADVTEGTFAGVGVNWERCRYDWSQPGSVKATVTDSNVYGVPGSYWEVEATPEADGSRVEMTWERRFQHSPRGRFFGFMFGKVGNPIFGRQAREILKNMEKLEEG